MKRRESRQYALELIFEGSFHNFENPAVLYENAVSCREFADNEYSKTLFFGVCDKQSEIDALIEETAKDWKVERISKLALAVLRLGIFEMKYQVDVPFTIVINEAIELLKEYDSNPPTAFINGILNKVAEKEGLKSI
ncbi:MAG: transcription antitermination factor NusB [Clostridiales bacterium]|nr:transcription antitermination factor NusB [Clostridiales bacterium]